MFCKNCGQTIDDNAVVCPHCGVQVGNVKTAPKDENSIAVIGFVLFFFGLSFVGLILSIIGYKNAKNGADHKGLAVAGIVLNALEVGSVALFFIIFIGTCVAACAAGSPTAVLSAII